MFKILLFLIPSLVQASTFSNETELSFISSGGNTKTSTYNLKTSSTFESDKLWQLGLGGHYLLTTSEVENENNETITQESARNWSIFLKPEKNLNKRLSLFSQVQYEGNKLAGYLQRDNYDIGGKYYFTNIDKEKFFIELGYRYTSERQYNLETRETKNKYLNKSRLYTEYKNSLDKTLSYKFWIEYLPNFTQEEDYIIKAEPSLSILFNNIFSMKLAYQAVYDNEPISSENEYLDYTYTTSLIIKL